MKCTQYVWKVLALDSLLETKPANILHWDVWPLIEQFVRFFWIVDRLSENENKKKTMNISIKVLLRLDHVLIRLKIRLDHLTKSHSMLHLSNSPHFLMFQDYSNQKHQQSHEHHDNKQLNINFHIRSSNCSKRKHFTGDTFKAFLSSCVPNL